MRCSGFFGLALLITGCGTVDNSGVEEPADMAMAPDLVPSYPPGPYGADVNHVLANLTFQGYFNPKGTTGLSRDMPFGEVNLEMVRNSGARYALLMLAGFW